MTLERASVFEKCQIGVESIPGTAVAATKYLPATSLEVDPQVTSQEFKPQGSKYTTIVAEQKEWLQVAVRGYPSYGDIIYLLSSVVGTPVTSNLVDGSTATPAYKWAFDSSSNGPDTPITYTIEQGSSVRAMRYTNALMKEIQLKFSRQSVEISGQFLATALQDGISLTGGVTAVELVPMLADGWDLFVDPTFGALGTTQVARLFDGTLALGNRWGAVWPVNSSKQSYTATVELAPTLTFMAILEADAAGMAYLQTLRNGTTVFARIRSLGAPTSLTSQGGGIYAYGGRTDATAAVTSGNVLIPDTAAASTDVGKAVSAPFGSTAVFPAGTVVASVVAGTSITVNAGHAPTASGTGVIVGTPVSYSMTTDIALKVGKIGKFSDQEGVYAVEFNYVGVADSGWGKAYHIEVVNQTATL